MIYRMLTSKKYDFFDKVTSNNMQTEKITSKIITIYKSMLKLKRLRQITNHEKSWWNLWLLCSFFLLLPWEDLVDILVFFSFICLKIASLTILEQQGRLGCSFKYLGAIVTKDETVKGYKCLSGPTLIIRQSSKIEDHTIDR